MYILHFIMSLFIISFVFDPDDNFKQFFKKKSIKIYPIALLFMIFITIYTTGNLVHHMIDNKKQNVIEQTYTNQCNKDEKLADGYGEISSITGRPKIHYVKGYYRS